MYVEHIYPNLPLFLATLAFSLFFGPTKSLPSTFVYILFFKVLGTE